MSCICPKWDCTPRISDSDNNSDKKVSEINYYAKRPMKTPRNSPIIKPNSEPMRRISIKAQQVLGEK